MELTLTSRVSPSCRWSHCDEVPSAGPFPDSSRRSEQRLALPASARLKLFSRLSNLVFAPLGGLTRLLRTSRRASRAKLSVVERAPDHEQQ